MNILETTKEYYSKWLGVSIEMMNSKGIFFVESTERDKKQTGYSKIFDVYAYAADNLVIVSYSKRLFGKIKNYYKFNEPVIITDSGCCTYKGSENKGS